MNRICNTATSSLGRRFAGGAVVRPGIGAPLAEAPGRSVPARRET